MTLWHFSSSSSPTAVAEALRANGAAIVDRLIDDSLVDRVLAETEPYLAATATGTEGFSGRRTRRTGSLIARSPAARELATHAMVLGVCDEILEPNASSYQLHLTQVSPEEPAQMLHRDHSAWDAFAFPAGFEVEISTIWAMQDFTDANGATRVVPGSHRWEDGRTPTQDDTEPAEMARGSVLIYTGSVQVVEQIVEAGEQRRYTSSRPRLGDPAAEPPQRLAGAGARPASRQELRRQERVDGAAATNAATSSKPVTSSSTGSLVIRRRTRGPYVARNSR